MPVVYRVGKYCLSALLIFMSLYWMAAVVVTGWVFLKFMGLSGLFGFLWLAALFLPLLGGVLYTRRKLVLFGTEQATGWFLVLCCFFLYLIFLVAVCCFSPQQMVSDFSKAQQCLESGRIMTLHNPAFKHWCNYEVLLSACGVLFYPTLLTGQLLNIVCISLAVYPVFRMIARMTDQCTATVISLAMIVYPTNLLFGTFLVQDFVFAALAVWGMYAFLAAMDNPRLVMKTTLVLSAAFFWAVAQTLKPIIPVVLVALAGGIMLICLAKEKVRGFFKRSCTVFFALMLFFVFFNKLIGGGMLTFYEHSPSRGYSLVPWKALLVGLDVKNEGRYSEDAAKTRAMTSDEAREICLRRIKEDYRSYPVLFAKKTIRLHCCDKWALGWFESSTTGNGAILPAAVVYSGHFAFVVLIAISILYSTIIWLRRKTLDFGFLLSILIVFGFTALLCLVETQGRYRTAFYPMYFISMSYGVAALRSVKGLKCF